MGMGSVDGDGEMGISAADWVEKMLEEMMMVDDDEATKSQFLMSRSPPSSTL